jgi:hypothetical protein
MISKNISHKDKDKIKSHWAHLGHEGHEGQFAFIGFNEITKYEHEMF